MRNISKQILILNVAAFLIQPVFGMYHQKIGRFMQHDPLGVAPNSEDSMMGPLSEYWDGLNLFEYTKSSPLVSLDPAGLFGQCGPGGLGGLLIPDDPWPFGGANFTDACKNHDECYSGKGPGGCSAQQKDCDDKFRDDMYKACDSKYGNQKDWFGNSRADWCKKKIADTYYNAVKDHGESSFNNAQKGNCPCPGAGKGIGPGGNGGGVIYL